MPREHVRMREADNERRTRWCSWPPPWQPAVKCCGGRCPASRSRQTAAEAVSARIRFAKTDNLLTQPFDAVICHGDSDQLRELCDRDRWRPMHAAIVSRAGALRAGKPTCCWSSVSVRGALAPASTRRRQAVTPALMTIG